jgi:sugar phosphate isomerase/epimerase
VDGRNELLLLAEPDEFTTFLARLDHHNVGILVDTGHLNVSATTLGFRRAEFIDLLAPFVGGFHVHDNDGSADQHRPVEGGSWVLDVLRAPRFTALPVIIESVFASVADLAAYYKWFNREVTQWRGPKSR